MVLGTIVYNRVIGFGQELYQLLLNKAKEYFIPEFFYYKNLNQLIGMARDEVMDKDNQMGRLLIDIDHLKDKLQDQDTKLVQTGLDWDKFWDEITWLWQIISAWEAKILGLQNSLAGIQSQLLLNQGEADRLRQNWETAQVTIKALEEAKSSLKEVANLIADVT